MSSAGKKNKQKWKPVAVTEVLNTVVRSSTTTSWAEEVESELLNEYHLKKLSNISLPTAPRAACDLVIDESKIPTNGPFTAYLSNLPYDITEEDIIQRFKELKIASIQLPKDSRHDRMKGFGYVEFKDKSSLLSALTEEEVNLKGRPVRITLPSEDDHKDKPSRSGNTSFSRNRDFDRIDGSEKVLGEWRANVPIPHDPEKTGFLRGQQNNRDSSGGGSSGFSEQRNNFHSDFENKSFSFRERDDRRSIDRDRRGGDKYFSNKRFERDDRNGGGRSMFRRNRYDGDEREFKPAPEKEELKTRPKIEIQPRSIPIDANNVPAALPSSIFGGAKPVDTTKREKEIEAKLNLAAAASTSIHSRGATPPRFSPSSRSRSSSVSSHHSYRKQEFTANETSSNKFSEGFSQNEMQLNRQEFKKPATPLPSNNFWEQRKTEVGVVDNTASNAPPTVIYDLNTADCNSTTDSVDSKQRECETGEVSADIVDEYEDTLSKDTLSSSYSTSETVDKHASDGNYREQLRLQQEQEQEQQQWSKGSQAINESITETEPFDNDSSSSLKTVASSAASVKKETCAYSEDDFITYSADQFSPEFSQPSSGSGSGRYKRYRDDRNRDRTKDYRDNNNDRRFDRSSSSSYNKNLESDNFSSSGGVNRSNDSASYGSRWNNNRPRNGPQRGRFQNREDGYRNNYRNDRNDRNYDNGSNNSMSTSANNNRSWSTRNDTNLSSGGNGGSKYQYQNNNSKYDNDNRRPEERLKYNASSNNVESTASPDDEITSITKVSVSTAVDRLKAEDNNNAKIVTTCATITTTTTTVSTNAILENGNKNEIDDMNTTPTKEGPELNDSSFCSSKSSRKKDKKRKMQEKKENFEQTIIEKDRNENEKKSSKNQKDDKKHVDTSEKSNKSNQPKNKDNRNEKSMKKSRDIRNELDNISHKKEEKTPNFQDVNRFVVLNDE